MIGYAVAAIAGAVGLFARSEYERKHFITEEYTIYSAKLKKEEQNFVFLSDLHNKEFGENNGKLLDAVDRIKPDGILIGGDMITSNGKEDPGVLFALLRELASRYPVYYGNGNHEERMRDHAAVYGDRYEAFKRELTGTGVHYLSDAGVDIGEDIRITGCNMEERYYSHRFSLPKLPKGGIRRHVGKVSRERFQILLLHSPLFFSDSREWGADLTLSGHFHGGTIRLPFFGGVMTPQYQFFLPWCAGRFDEEGKTMIVSRGLGTHSVNIRLNNRPQLVWVKLRRGKGL